MSRILVIDGDIADPLADNPHQLFERLHARVLDGDEAAIEYVAHALLVSLRRRLRRAYPTASEDAVVDAAEDAILDYLANPDHFDIARGVSLLHFTYVAAWRNLASSVKSESRRRTREQIYAKLAWTNVQDPPLPATPEERTTIIFDAAIDQAERRALACWFAGDATATLANALGCANMPLSAQRREVKRFKDRMVKRLARLRSKNSHG